MITKPKEVDMVTVCWSASLNTANGAYDVTVFTAMPIVDRVEGVKYISADRVVIVEYPDADKIRISTRINDVVSVYHFNNVSRYSFIHKQKEATE